MPNELELDREFWAALESNPAFRERLLQRTRFWPRKLDLVTDEEWRQRWYRDPETGRDSETDILLIWNEPRSGERFALHIENKPAHRKWEPAQVENYARRAENRKKAWRYVDYELVLLAPVDFVARHLDDAARFDFVLTYEEVSAFAPAFGAAVPPAAAELDPVDVLRVELLRRSLEPELMDQQPWLAEVRKGRFESIPEDFGWETSCPLAHMIEGYEVFDDTIGLANERLELATQNGEWTGNPLELWACLFGEHRRARFSFEPVGEQITLYDELCQTLRTKLIAARAN